MFCFYFNSFDSWRFIYIYIIYILKKIVSFRFLFLLFKTYLVLFSCLFFLVFYLWVSKIYPLFGIFSVFLRLSFWQIDVFFFLFLATFFFLSFPYSIKRYLLSFLSSGLFFHQPIILIQFFLFTVISLFFVTPHSSFLFQKRSSFSLFYRPPSTVRSHFGSKRPWNSAKTKLKQTKYISFSKASKFFFKILTECENFTNELVVAYLKVTTRAFLFFSKNNTLAKFSFDDSFNLLWISSYKLVLAVNAVKFGSRNFRTKKKKSRSHSTNWVYLF